VYSSLLGFRSCVLDLNRAFVLVLFEVVLEDGDELLKSLIVCLLVFPGGVKNLKKRKDGEIGLSEGFLFRFCVRFFPFRFLFLSLSCSLSFSLSLISFSFLFL
jgi:hypothetical protein